MPNSRRREWSPEEIADMKARLAGGATLAAVGKVYSITGERVRQLAGNVNRPHPLGWKPPQTGNAEKNRLEVERLCKAGFSDEAIAKDLSLSVLYVGQLRMASGHRLTFSHTPEHDVWCALKWRELYGYTPAASDWNPPTARAMGHIERAERFEAFRKQFNCPYVSQIQRRHVSWKKFIAKTGLPRPPIGFAARGRFSDVPKNIGTWRPTTPEGGWSQDSILNKASEWEERYGKWPRPVDWDLQNWRYKPQYQDRLRRFETVNPPTFQSVRYHFDSFQAMVDEAKKRKQAAG